MSDHSSDEPQLVLRWYTRARRVPRFIGRTPGGGHWPGGPYTLTQAAGAALMLVLGQVTMPVWGRYGFIGNNLTLAILVIVTLVGLRFVKPGGRDPLTAVFSVAAVAAAPSWGKQAGRSIRMPARPTRVRLRVNAQTGPASASPPQVLPDTEGVDIGRSHTGAEPSTASMSVLQQLMRHTNPDTERRP